MCPSVDAQIDKPWLICTMERCSAIKERLFDAHNNLDEFQRHYAECKKSNSKAVHPMSPSICYSPFRETQNYSGRAWVSGGSG